jgi:orotidine-5'-phosphate decarboxylase
VSDVRGSGFGQVRERIIVALDLPDAATAMETARRLAGHASWVKVGMTLFFAEGPAIVQQLRSLGFRVFVDLKLHDIPHQVSGACAALVRAGADMVTVHASGGRAMLEAAVRVTAAAAEEAGVARPLVVAVTVLTSLDDDALAEVGVRRSMTEQVRGLARIALEVGCDGVVCSPQEAAAMRDLCGERGVVVTPGVRPASASGVADDQVRVATPAGALAAGASHLVVGRPITGAADPVSAFEAIAAEGAAL